MKSGETGVVILEHDIEMSNVSEVIITLSSVAGEIEKRLSQNEVEIKPNNKILIPLSQDDTIRLSRKTDTEVKVEGQIVFNDNPPTVCKTEIVSFKLGATLRTEHVAGANGAEGQYNAVSIRCHAGVIYANVDPGNVEALVEEKLTEALANNEVINGKDGKDGRDGVDGADGKSAYELAVENGFEGTVEEWLDSLKGDGSEIDLSNYATKDELANAGVSEEVIERMVQDNLGENVVTTEELETNTDSIKDWADGKFADAKLEFVEIPYTKIGGKTRSIYNVVTDTSSTSAWFITEPIAVQKGQTVKWNASGYKAQTAMISTCAENGENVTVRVSSVLGADGNDYNRTDYTYTATQDCYVTLSAFTKNSSNVPTLSIANANTLVEHADETITSMKHNDINLNICHVFQKVVVVGDSYTQGYINNASNTLVNMPDYSWVAYMGKKTGQNWINRGVSGTTAKTWQTNANGLPKVVADGKAQAYIIGLGINDSATSGNNALPVGTVEDIGTDGDTYYAQYSKLVSALAEISPNAVFILNTCPWDITENATRVAPYNEAVKNIVEHFKSTLNIHCLDLAGKYSEYFGAEFKRFTSNAHPTTLGHARIANIMEYALSDYMHDNAKSFEYVPWIEYDTVQS